MPEVRVVVIGGGHNGLVCAAYLARKGASVTLVERRDLLGGAASTEELWPGFRISRAAYVLGLFRPQILEELQLARFGLRLLPRYPSSFTPLPDGRALVLGYDREHDLAEIARFSKHDAEAYPHYQAFLEKIARALEPTLDRPPPSAHLGGGSDLVPWFEAARLGARLGRDFSRSLKLLLGPARALLDEWFDSEPLKATLATDAVIGAFASPSTPGTGYVLFHHVMGSVTGRRGVWAYVEGGMGGLADALERSARAAGVRIRTAAPVAQVLVREERAVGIALEDGEEIQADIVVSSADPYHTFKGLVGEKHLPENFVRGLNAIDFRSPVFKINATLSALPDFHVTDRDAPPPLGGTIHLGASDLDAIERAFDQARGGEVSERPLVELVLPTVLDRELAPEGKHIASFFAQYAPELPMDDPGWGRLRDLARDRVLALCDEAAPGFSDRIEELEVLAPPDLEQIYGLTGGNIFHGAMSPDRLLFMRPLPDWANYRTPLDGLYLCGAGTHPGGGVMGACGRNAALEIAREFGRERFWNRVRTTLRQDLPATLSSWRNRLSSRATPKAD